MARRLARAHRSARRAAGPPPCEVRLTWPGRCWTPGAPAAPSPEAELVELVGAAPAPHRLVHGDALGFARALGAEGLAGEVDLVYVDPPYASERDYVAEARLDGPADGRAVRTLAYEDRWSEQRGGIGAYLEMLAPRLEALASLLSPRGTIWVHLDWRAAYLVRGVLDEILGRDAFVNEIVWRRAPNLGRQAASSQFGRTLDTLLVYGREEARLRPPTRLDPIEPSAIRWDDEGRPFTSAPRGDYTDASITKLEAEGRVHRTASGRVYIKYFLVKNEAGVLCRERRADALWTDVPPLRHAAASERTGYPTQKPRALLERIVACATSPGSSVVDAFAGSGTTGAAAHALGRRAFLADASPVAIATARARLLRDGAALRVERLADVAAPAAAHVEAKLDGGAVRLVAPTEPLAWAVGHVDGGVFHTAWHAERAPGARPTPAPLDAPAGRGADVDVRVYLDDGSVGAWSSGARARTTPPVERTRARAEGVTP